MLSAAASLGLIHLWDVHGGLTPIDKYLYTSEEYIKVKNLIINRHILLYFYTYKLIICLCLGWCPPCSGNCKCRST